MTAEKLQKLWNLATRNPNENEALVAARKFIRAINNAYQKGINDVKAQYQRELDRHLNSKYNEGYLDGQRNGYSEDDMKRQYQKGYTAGQNSKAIQKSEPSDIVQNKQNTQSIVYGNGQATSTARIYLHNQSTGTIHIRHN